MLYKILLNNPDNKKFTQSVLQAPEMLALYYAELARILHLHCGDIGSFAPGKKYLQENSLAWTQAELFINFYNKLHDFFQADGVMMRHWMRVKDEVLGDTPFILIVDKNQSRIKRSKYSFNKN